MKSNFEIKINKEIRDYTESIFFGLSLRQSIFSIIACIIACGLYFLCKDRLGTEMTSWLCMLGAAPFASKVLTNMVTTEQEAFAIEQVEATVRAALTNDESLVRFAYTSFFIII